MRNSCFRNSVKTQRKKQGFVSGIHGIVNLDEKMQKKKFKKKLTSEKNKKKSTKKSDNTF